jgi:hypothetical protein
MAERKGLLLATMEPPPTMEEEFNDWYDTEHFPERRNCNGFLSAQRYVCLQGWPRYLAFYDLRSAGVLDGPDYRAFTGKNLGPWSRRILARVLGEYRAVGTLVYPSDAVSVSKPERAYMTLLRLVGVRKGGEAEIVAGLRQRFEGRSEVRQLRVFRSEDTRGREYLGVLELSQPLSDLDLDVADLGRRAGTLRLLNTYAAYWRKGIND